MAPEEAGAARHVEAGDGDGHHRPSPDQFERVYQQLRGAAQKAMNAERRGHTLSATALVHEAYLRLAGDRQKPWQSDAHFYAAAAQAMRRILIDHARAKGARGGSKVHTTAIPDLETLAFGDPEQILAVDAAVTRLENDDPEAASLVRLRFYAGLSVDKAAEAMNLSPRSAARLWTFARATLYRMLSENLQVERHDQSATPTSPRNLHGDIRRPGA